MTAIVLSVHHCSLARKELCSNGAVTGRHDDARQDFRRAPAAHGPLAPYSCCLFAPPLPPLLLHLDTQLRQRTCAATFLPSFDKHAQNLHTLLFFKPPQPETYPSSLRVFCHKARLSATHNHRRCIARSTCAFPTHLCRRFCILNSLRCFCNTLSSQRSPLAAVFDPATSNFST